MSAAFAVLAALVTGTTVGLGAGVSAAAGDVDGTVSGVVFQDFGSTGIYSTGDAAAGTPRNRPIIGVTATAYDADGDAVGTATSAADGMYTIDVTDAHSENLRVEFSGWDPGIYQPGFAAQGVVPADALGSNDTSVQFVELGSDDADHVDFSLVIPDQVIQADAPISTAIQYAGDPANPDNELTNDDAIVAQPWSVTGSAEVGTGWPFGRVELASFGEVGAIWGTSYVRNGNRMLASPTLKRMSGIGPGGPGAIYQITDVLNADGTLNPNPPAPTPWVDVQVLAVVNGAGTIDIGDIPSNDARGLGDHQTPATDIVGFADAARVGIGGMATSLDGRALFITNLFDGQVYGIPIADPDVPPTQTVRIDTPVVADQQIWAITTYQDRLYIGYVDTGSRPGLPAAEAGMNAYVVSASVGELVDAVSSGTPVSAAWRTELTVDLGYAKGSNMRDWPTRDTPTPETPSTCPQTENGSNSMEEWFPQLTRWNSWTDSWSWDSDGAPVDSDDPFDAAVQAGGGTVGLPGGCFYGTGWEQVYAQPVLSGITFDIDGYMVLALTDRNSIQSGTRNEAAVTTPTPGRFWETLANGDTLIAAPAALAPGVPPDGCPAATGQNYVLECNGVVGTRGPRTDRTGPPDQDTTYNNNEGPVTGEFLNDKINTGTGANHNENTLGSVVTYPGVDEIAATAIDPLVGKERTGLMWFDQNTGLATRGFDQVIGTNGDHAETFQKGGGLGSVALLGIAAPVEIGNRVWLDADLNGRQDPDEPAINGAPVQLWTATAAAPNTPVCLIDSTSTATVNGQPGTYYFRSDDLDLQDVACDGSPPVSFTTDANYVVVFPGTGDDGGLASTDAVALAGPNSDHPGFAGLTWGQLQRTDSEVAVAPTAANGGTTGLNDSNPAVDTGRASVTVGGPGENDHTIDAGWYGLAPYQVEKTVTGAGPPNRTYTVEVLAATNFRGDDRLIAAGTDPGGRDPQVTETSFELVPGVPQTSTEQLPYGYTLTLKETDPVLPDDAVRYDPADPDDPTQGLVVISPQPAGQVVTLEVTNDYGSFQVVKTNEGDQEAVDAVADLEFTVNWTSDQPDAGGDTEGSFTVTGDGTPAPDPALSFPVGTQVTLSEVEPTNLPPRVAWTGGTWTAAPPNVVVNADGTATVTIAGNDEEPVQVGLTNTFSDAFGNFTVTKAIDPDSDFPDLGDPIYDTVQIPFTYSYTVPGESEVTGQTFTLNRANGFVFTSQDYPTDTTVTVTEGTPTGLPVSMEMTFEGWTVDGEPATSPVTFTIGDDTTTALVVTNSTREKVGTFEVSKQFTQPDPDDPTSTIPLDPDDPQLAEVVVTITWTAPDASTGTIELTQDNDWTGGPTDVDGNPITFPLGTVIDLEETDVTGVPPSLELTGDVTWSPADPDDATKGQVTISDEEVAASATVVNGTEAVVGTFSLSKALSEDSDFAITDPELAGVSFTVNASWEAQPELGVTEPGDVDLVLNQANNWSTALGQTLPVGTVVTLSEIAMSGAPPNVEWDGTPAWGPGVTPNPDGTATLVITKGEQAPEIVVTNTLTELFGTFGVAKAVDGDFDLDSPELADAAFTVTATWPAAPGLDAGSVVLVLNAENGFALPSGVELPTGTVVTLSEAVPSGTPPSVGWGDVTWSGDGLTVNEDGTASFVVGDGTAPVFTVTNTATELTGTFGVAKAVDGDFDLDSPELADAAFTVTASWPAAPGLDAGSVVLVLNAENGFALPSGVELPTGTVVTLSEAVPSGTPPSVGWGDVTWSGEGLTVNEDGTASFVVGDDTNPTFTVTNTATELTGSFSVLKQVTGDGASYLDPATEFTVSYTYEGLAEPGTLTVTDGETVAGPELPIGTVVTLSEIVPTGGLSGGATWGTPVFVLPDGTTGSTATVTVSTEPVAVVLQNPASPPPPTTPPTTPPTVQPTTTLPTTPPTVPPTTPTMPNTGVDVAGMSLTGLALLILGGALVLLTARRRTGDH